MEDKQHEQPIPLHRPALPLYGADAGDMSFLNKTMRTLGLASVAYTLGTTDAKVNFNDGVMGITKFGNL